MERKKPEFDTTTDDFSPTEQEKIVKMILQDAKSDKEVMKSWLKDRKKDLKNNEGVRMSVTITGTNKVIAEKVWEMVEQLASGKPIEKKEIYRELIPVTKENVDEYLNK